MCLFAHHGECSRLGLRWNFIATQGALSPTLREPFGDAITVESMLALGQNEQDIGGLEGSKANWAILTQRILTS
jgi:hypothetical protein